MFRNWWKSQSEESRSYYKSQRHWFAAGGLFLVVAGFIHYETHLSETPITQRRRYLAFTPQQFKELADYEFKVVSELFITHTLMILLDLQSSLHVGI